MTTDGGPKAPGPMHDVLKQIAALVLQHDGDPASAEHVLARIGVLVTAQLEEPLTVEVVAARINHLRVLMAQHDYEAAHGQQVALYERLLGDYARRGDEVARAVLEAAQVVHTWE